MLLSYRNDNKQVINVCSINHIGAGILTEIMIFLQFLNWPLNNCELVLRVFLPLRICQSNKKIKISKLCLCTYKRKKQMEEWFGLIFFFLCWYTTSKYEVESNIRQQAVLQCFYPNYIEISREFSIGNWFGSEITKTRSMEFVINIHTL